MSVRLRFDADLQILWPDEEVLFKADIEEAIHQQLEDCEKQKREAPYYNIWTATSFTYLTTIYTSGSPLRLEATAQAELPYKVKLTREERERAVDPNYQDDDKESSPEPAPIEPERRVEKQLKSHFTNSTYWVGPANSEGRRAKPKDTATTAPQPAPTTPQPAPTAPSAGPSQPPPASTASSTAPPPPRTIYRVADGLFFRREKLSSLRTRDSGKPQATVAPAVPVASVEVKVPKWKRQPKQEKDNGDDGKGEDKGKGKGKGKGKDEGKDEGEEEDDSQGDAEEDAGVIWIIDQEEAIKAIHGGMAQIVQQIQFIFHNWTKLDVVWAIGASGRWAQFFRFTRSDTPEIDYATISNETDDVKSTQYYPGPRPAAQIPDAEESADDVFEAVNDDGSFTEEFKEYWRLVIDDAEKEFIRMEGLDSE
ncbi:hypothetical protein BDZ89DRAFT_1158791 [Hymenopellis radicata]|nr:hypothetical protein BDZ89DRAFT_1158791 [Hymenopellis radicata]